MLLAAPRASIATTAPFAWHRACALTYRICALGLALALVGDFATTGAVLALSLHMTGSLCITVAAGTTAEATILALATLRQILVGNGNIVLRRVVDV